MRFSKNILLLMLLFSSVSSNLHSLTPRQINQITFATAGAGMALVGLGALKYSAPKAEETDTQKEKRRGDTATLVIVGTVAVITASCFVHGILDKKFSPFGRYKRALKVITQYNQDPSILLAEAYQDNPELMASKLNELHGGWDMVLEGPDFVKTIYQDSNGFYTGEAYENLGQQLLNNHPLLKAEGKLKKLDNALQKAFSWCQKVLAESGSDSRVNDESAKVLSTDLGRSSHIVSKIIYCLQATGRYMAQAKSMAEVGMELKKSDTYKAFDFSSVTPYMKDFSQLWKN